MIYLFIGSFSQLHQDPSFDRFPDCIVNNALVSAFVFFSDVGHLEDLPIVGQMKPET